MTRDNDTPQRSKNTVQDFMENAYRRGNEAQERIADLEQQLAEANGMGPQRERPEPPDGYVVSNRHTLQAGEHYFYFDGDNWIHRTNGGTTELNPDIIYAVREQQPAERWRSVGTDGWDKWFAEFSQKTQYMYCQDPVLHQAIRHGAHSGMNQLETLELLLHLILESKEALIQEAVERVRNQVITITRPQPPQEAQQPEGGAK